MNVNIMSHSMDVLFCTYLNIVFNITIQIIFGSSRWQFLGDMKRRHMFVGPLSDLENTFHARGMRRQSGRGT